MQAMNPHGLILNTFSTNHCGSFNQLSLLRIKYSSVGSEYRKYQNQKNPSWKGLLAGHQSNPEQSHPRTVLQTQYQCCRCWGLFYSKKFPGLLQNTVWLEFLSQFRLGSAALPV